MTELADKIEAAKGPSRELDAEIKALVGDAWDYGADWGSRGHDKPVAFAYTASLDAAMTLVPEGRDYSIERVNGGHWCSVDSPTNDRPPRIKAATPALALCAASLRARASTNG